MSTLVVAVTSLPISGPTRYGYSMDIDTLIEKTKAYAAAAMFFWAGYTVGSPEFLMGGLAAFYLGYRFGLFGAAEEAKRNPPPPP
ncbi:hypothetical protein C8N36_1452 [Pelagimonas varians]|uniref:Uncharacterized protein n=1 Tax=Pelagimonas varians TaxID=696760 RepID=A0A238L6J8_9RHOB|nr:hypothetical protein C8N36_1452 [Pelagimonas varians]SMX50724.1 hypothetical protein PEV8663_04780 [Pelagimonas varians]